MVRIKKLVAYITVIAMLVISCNITAFAEQTFVEMGDTVCNGAVLSGNYTYTGAHICRWYASDNFFEKGNLVEGANAPTFTASSKTVDKFLTFAVVPVNADGTQGEEVCAVPVLQNQGYYADFTSGMTDNIKAFGTAVGNVSIVDDPAGTGEKVLSIAKAHDSSFKQEVRVNFDKVTATDSVVDVYIYAKDIQGTSKLFGVYSDTYGSVLELQTDSEGKLYYRAYGNLKESSLGFSENEWHHLVISIDGDNKTVKASLDDESIFSGEEKWRFENDGYNNIAMSFINYGNGGSVYIKNLAVMSLASKDVAEEDANFIATKMPSEVTESFTLPSVGENGCSIFWKSDKPQYITNDGTVTRPKYGDGDAVVTMTAYIFNGSIKVERTFKITVIESVLPPVAENVKIIQESGRYVKATYEYYDDNFNAQDGSVLRWYVEEQDGYKIVDGANELIFIPTEDFDGKNIKFSVTPRNVVGVIGEETFSEPLVYHYFETRMPVMEITHKSINPDGAFEFKCKYISPDYIKEGNSVIKWYMSETLFGDYTVIEGVESTTYDPVDKSAFYKFSVTPVDEEDNIGEEVVVGPFTYVDASINQLKAAENALRAVEMPASTYVDLELPQISEEGAIYTWVSESPEIIDNNGVITRPAAGTADANASLTVYATCGFQQVSSEYIVAVKKYTTPPVVTEQQLYQESRPIKLRYTFTDAENDAKGNMIYEWYYKSDANSDFVLIEGANGDMYAPAMDMDGYIFIAKITPVDDTFTVGEQVTTPEYTYKYRTPAKPSAKIRTTIRKGLTLTGDYSYINPDGIPEGDSEYKWYVSAKLFGDYIQISGENAKSLAYDTSYDGKYVKFIVVPKDAEGITGEPVEAIPVLISFEAVETFNEDFDMSGKINTAKLSGGTVSIADDPAGKEGNTVLKLERTSDLAGEQSMIRYLLPNYTGAAYIIIEADIYNALTVNNTWNVFLVGGEGYMYKVVEKKDNKVWSRGGKEDGSADSNDLHIGSYKKNAWQHMKLVLDMERQMVLECSLGGKVLQTNKPFRGNTYGSVPELVSYMEGAAVGSGYIDNLQVTPVYSTKKGSLAEADAKEIELNADLNEVTSNLNLPLIGSINSSAITWTSSDENVITSRGKVSRPKSTESDKKVTLTAHVVKGNDYYARTFEITVMRELTDKDIVERDMAILLENYDGSITDRDIELPLKGKYGATYKWESSDKTIISNIGAVKQYDEKKEVTFDVTLTHNDYSDSVKVHIVIAPIHGENLVVTGGISTSSAKADYHFANAGDGDYSTYWSSLEVDKAPFAILDMGKIKEVNQLYIADEFKSVSSILLFHSTDKSSWEPVEIIKGFERDSICTVEFKKESARYIRVNFTGVEEICVNELILMYQEADSDKVASSIDEITLPVNGSVTNDFTIMTELEDGTKIDWKSSNTTAISITGNKAAVTRGKSNASVTLTATVKIGSEVNFKIFTLVVTGTDGGNGGGGGGGGGSSIGGGSGDSNEDIPPAIIPDEPKVSFTDITSVPWAQEAITKLASIGVVNGTSATTFEPERNITREEFAAILYRGFGFDRVAVGNGFDDVEPTDWCYDAVMQLSSLGIINGIGEGSFGIGETINRQDMAVMIYRAAKVASLQFTTEGTTFADADIISSYAKEAIDALSGSQIINGVGDNYFNPRGKATRAEATVILSRIMDYIKQGGNEK